MGALLHHFSRGSVHPPSSGAQEGACSSPLSATELDVDFVRPNIKFTL